MPAMYARFDKSSLGAARWRPATYEVPPAQQRRQPRGPVDEDGLYATFHASGQLAHLAAFVKRRCQSALWLEDGQAAGYADDGTAGVAYYADGTVETFSAFDDSSKPTPASISFERWAREAIDRVIREASPPPVFNAKAREFSALAIDTNELMAFLQSGAPYVLYDVRNPKDKKRAPVPEAKATQMSKLLSKPRDLPQDRAVLLLASGDAYDAAGEVRSKLIDAKLPFLHVVGIKHGGVTWNHIHGRIPGVSPPPPPPKK